MGPMYPFTHPEWKLRIVGPDEVNHARDLLVQVKSLGLEDSVSIEAAGFLERRKVRLMARASLFVLPTLHENFAMTVAESLSVETPVISTVGAPWQGLEDQRCGWWIPHGTHPMIATLKSAMSLPQKELQIMGARGRAWMKRDFGWGTIACKMFNYLSVVEKKRLTSLVGCFYDQASRRTVQKAPN